MQLSHDERSPNKRRLCLLYDHLNCLVKLESSKTVLCSTLRSVHTNPLTTKVTKIEIFPIKIFIPF